MSSSSPAPVVCAGGGGAALAGSNNGALKFKYSLPLPAWAGAGAGGARLRKSARGFAVAGTWAGGAGGSAGGATNGAGGPFGPPGAFARPPIIACGTRRRQVGSQPSPSVARHSPAPPGTYEERRGTLIDDVCGHIAGLVSPRCGSRKPPTHHSCQLRDRLQARPERRATGAPDGLASRPHRERSARARAATT